MRTRNVRLACSLVAVSLLMLAGGLASAGPEKAPAAKAAGSEIALTYKAARTWSYDLPEQRFTTISRTIDFVAAGGKRYGVALEGQALAVDTDGDGTHDVRVEGKSAFIHLKTQVSKESAAQGAKPFSYALRLVNPGSGWRYAAGGARIGKIGTTRITLIDQDGDGRYDGYGKDAMIVGRSKSACFLSRVVNVAGELHGIEVAKDGTSLRHAPHKGPAGTLDLASKWDAKAKLQSVIVRSADGAYSFDLSKATEGLKVPTATYLLHSGKLGLGENVVRFRQGRAKAAVVAKDGRTVVAAGGPLTAEFGYQRRGAEILFDPAALRYFGRAGEEYVTWKPFGKSPEFTVTDTKVSKTIAKAIFTGC